MSENGGKQPRPLIVCTVILTPDNQLHVVGPGAGLSLKMLEDSIEILKRRQSRIEVPTIQPPKDVGRPA